MAELWITPQDVKDYSSYEDVQNKSDVQLNVYIQRAMTKIVNHTHNKFLDSEGKLNIPDEIRNITILLTEAIIHNEYVERMKKVKSETFDDYSYTAEYTLADLSVILADIPEEYFISSTGNVGLKMFKI